MKPLGDQPNGRHLHNVGGQLALATAGDRPHPRFCEAAVGRRSSALVIELLRLVDAATALVAVGLVFLVVNLQRMPGGLDVFLLQRVSLKNLLVAACFVLVWQELFVVFGLYDAARRLSVREEVMRVMAACSVGCLTLFALPLVSTNPWFRAWHIVAVWLLSTATTLLARQLLRLGAWTPASSPVQRVIIVGTGPRAVRVYEELCMHQPFRYVLVGFVDRPADVSSQFVRRRLLGGVEELDRILMEYAVDEVLVALPIKSCYAMIQQTIDVCERAGVQANYLADVFRTSMAKPRYDESHITPVVSMRVATDDQRMAVKRVVDVVGATVGLVVCAPLMLLIALAIKLTSPGPAFYTQVRHGLRRRRFRLFKFRTMVTNAEAMLPMLESHNEAAGPVFKIKQDPRTTKIGRLLRRLSFDELPQLVNVLKGDMSLVGPRPLPTRDLAHFREAWLIRRFSVPQGLTGLWQVSGRSDLDFDDWMTLDLKYIDQWSLTLDARILFRTIPAIVSGRGAS